MFSEQKLPVSTPPEQIWTLRYREQCTKWAGLSTQTAISTESAHQNDLTRCAVYTQYVILRSPRIVPVTNLNEAVPRTFHSARNMNACVPRTCSENILPGFCTENIYERAPNFSFISFCIKMLKNKAQIAARERQKPRELPGHLSGHWTPAAPYWGTSGFSLVMCMRAHNLLRPPPLNENPGLAPVVYTVPIFQINIRLKYNTLTWPPPKKKKKKKTNKNTHTRKTKHNKKVTPPPPLIRMA